VNKYGFIETPYQSSRTAWYSLTISTSPRWKRSA